VGHTLRAARAWALAKGGGVRVAWHRLSKKGIDQGAGALEK
jgi:hypothetical protein